MLQYNYVDPLGILAPNLVTALIGRGVFLSLIIRIVHMLGAASLAKYL